MEYLLQLKEIAVEPYSYVFLAILLALIARYQKRISLEDKWVFRWKHKVLYSLNPILSKDKLFGREFIRDKTPDKWWTAREYAYSTDATVKEVKEAASEVYETNLASTSKYRVIDGEKQWELWSFKYSIPDTDKMYHLYIFEGHGDYNTDMNQHKETDWEDDPKGHEDDKQKRGDPEGFLKNVMNKAGISVERDKEWVMSFYEK